MQVDQGKAIIRLVEGNVVRGISDLYVEDDLSVVLGVDGGGFCDTTDGLAIYCHCCVGVEEVEELGIGEV